VAGTFPLNQKFPRLPRKIERLVLFHPITQQPCSHQNRSAMTGRGNADITEIRVMDWDFWILFYLLILCSYDDAAMGIYL
jgi:hypothetical protein